MNLFSKRKTTFIFKKEIIICLEILRALIYRADKEKFILKKSFILLQV